MDTFRKIYTELDQDQKDKMAQCKEMASQLEVFFDVCVPRDERSEKSRCMAIARTNLETAIMYAVKAITTKKA